MSQTAAQQRYLRVGIILMVAGAALALAAAYAVHLIGLPEKNSFGADLYPRVPRGWIPTLLAQIISLSGLLVAMAGMALALLYKREMTWARASIGAFLFTGLMIILYGVIPNEFLTVTQSKLDWSGLKEWVKIPKVLTLGNEITISAAAIKDLIGQGYILTVTAGIAVTMWKWQERSKRLAEQGPPVKVSKYGRPLTKVER
jgi:hypothetical protein